MASVSRLIHSVHIYSVVKWLVFPNWDVHNSFNPREMINPGLNLKLVDFWCINPVRLSLPGSY